MKSMFLKSMSAGAAMAAFLVFPAISSAAIISGRIDGGGSLTLTSGNVAFTNTGVAGAGIFTIAASTIPQIPVSTTLNPSTATIQPLNQPVGVTLNVPNFISFSAAPTISVTLTRVDPSVYAPITLPSCITAPATSGQICGLAGTPFNLGNGLIDNTTTPPIKSSSDFFSIRGTVVDSSAPSQTSAFSGIFTAQFADKSYQDVAAAIQTGGAVPTTYSASFIATPNAGVPEPATMSFMGLGLLALAAGVRRRARQ